MMPRFYMYDIARGAYLRPETFKKVLRHAAACGYTHFIPYLENMIRLQTIEKAARSFAYTPRDWLTFQETAEDCGIELVPHFNVIGHSNELCLAYPELTGKNSVSSDSDRRKTENFASCTDPAYFAEMDPELDRSKEIILKCLDEYCSFSRSRYFLIGGDEWNVSAHLLVKKGFDPGRAWCTFVNMAVKYLVSRRRVPIVWHDMLVHYPYILSELSREAVIAFWFYDDDSGYPFLQTLKAFGFRTIMATGLCLGALSQRRHKAFCRALAEAEKYQADGFMTTTWMDGRYDRQAANIALTGKMLEQQKIDPVFPETVTTSLYLEKLREFSAEKAAGVKETLLEQLKNKAWDEFPGYRRILQDTANENYDQLREQFAVDHYPAGPLFNYLVRKEPVVSRQRTLPEIPENFGIESSFDPLTGNTVRFYNAGETFVVYPDFGARLQDWRTREFALISHSLPGYLKNKPFHPPGSFKSFHSPGFMPMWNIGTHLNPNMIWQHPWDFEIDTANPERPALLMHLELAHVEVSYKIAIQKGFPGFSCQLEAVNLLPHVHGAFGWNFCISGSRVTETVFGKEQRSFFEVPNDLLQLEPSPELILKNPEWLLKASVPAEQCAGYWVDWGNSWMTPDLHGKYVPLAPGDTYRTEWHFSCVGVPSEKTSNQKG